MTYTAFGPDGPRIAMAQSRDLFKWERLGPVSYLPYKNIQFNGVDNKDAALFPADIPGPNGHPSIALLSRPLFPGTRPEETARHAKDREVDTERESMADDRIGVATMTLPEKLPRSTSVRHRRDLD